MRPAPALGSSEAALDLAAGECSRPRAAAPPLVSCPGPFPRGRLFLLGRRVVVQPPACPEVLGGQGSGCLQGGSQRSRPGGRREPQGHVSRGKPRGRAAAGAPWPGLVSLQWMRARWTSDPCYAFFGVDGTECSFLIYLSEVEWFCPPLPWRNQTSAQTVPKALPKVQVGLGSGGSVRGWWAAPGGLPLAPGAIRWPALPGGWAGPSPPCRVPVHLLGALQSQACLRDGRGPAGAPITDQNASSNGWHFWKTPCA